MKKILFSIMLLLAVTFALASCFAKGGSDEADNGGLPPDDSQNNTDVHVHTPGEQEVHVYEEPNCYKAGYGYYYICCTECGVTLEEGETTIDSPGHIAGRVEKEYMDYPNCTFDGSYIEYSYCQWCDELISFEEKTEPKNGEHWFEYYDDVIVPPTCISYGECETVKYCIYCEKEFSRVPDTLPMVNHTPLPAVEENRQEATCTQNGSYELVEYCSVKGCGVEISRYKSTIYKTGHTAADPVKENEIAATCTQKGSYNEVVYCASCSDLISTKLVTVPTSHDIDEYGICVRCDPDATRGLVYSETSGTATLVGRGTFTGDKLVLPSMYNGKRLTSINTNDFKNDTSLVSITVNSLIKSVNTSAFDGCYHLVEIISNQSFGAAIGSTNFGGIAYYALEIHKGESKVEKYNDFYFYALGGVNYLVGYSGNSESVTLPADFNGGKYEVNKYAFAGSDFIRDIRVSDGVTKIGEGAFLGCNIKSAAAPIWAVPFVSSEGLVSLTVTSGEIEKEAFAACTSLGEIIFGDGVTKIGENAFYNVRSLTSVTLGANVTEIGKNAFLGCYRIVEVINYSQLDLEAGKDDYGYVARYANEVHSGTSKIQNVGDYLFYTYGGTDYLVGYVGTDTELTLPESYNGKSYIIYENAFYDRADITSVTIPDTITVIGDYAFYGCTSLVNVTFGINVTEIGREAFRNCNALASVTFPGKITHISNSAFSGCTALTEIYIPDSVTSIGASAFSGCTALGSVIFAKSTDISNYAFYGCSSITRVEISDAEEWCRMSFGNEYANPLTFANKLYVNGNILEALVIPDSVTRINNYAFTGLTSLVSITIPNTVTSVGTDAFKGCVFVSATVPTVAVSHVVSEALETITINSGDAIADYSFVGCSSLCKVVIADSVTSVGSSAFSGCSALSEVVFGEGMISIGDKAFYDCSSLRSITVHASVNNIGADAFGGCFRLVEVINHSELGISKGSEEYGKIALYAIDVHNGASNIDMLGDYMFYANGEVNYLIGYVGSGLELILPESYNGENYEIYFRAFYQYGVIKNLVIGSSVTAIGNEAFLDCKIEKVSAPAFALQNISPSNLKQLTVISGDIADEQFKNLVNLESVILLNGVTSIGKKAFLGCTRLKEITIPDSVTKIGEAALSGCSSLESITLPFIGGAANGGAQCYPLGYIFGTESFSGATETNQRYSNYDGDYNYYKTYYIPDSLRSVTVTKGNIVYGAFSECSKITAVVIGDAVSYVGKFAFINCTGLTSITVGKSVKGIETQAFAGCSAVKTLEIPDSVTSMGSSVFYGCSALESLTVPFIGRTNQGAYDLMYQYPLGYMFATSQFPGSIRISQKYYGTEYEKLTTEYYYIPTSLKSVTVTLGDICYGAFYNCRTITSITLGDKVDYVSDAAFNNCQALEQIIIGSSVYNIGSGAFGGCDNLKRIDIKDIGQWCKMTFGESVFVGNSARLYLNGELVTRLVVPEDVTHINDYAFDGYECLVSVELHSNVRSIGKDAFKSCYSLVEIIERSSYITLTPGEYSESGISSYAIEIHTSESKIKEAGDYLFYTYNGVNYLVAYVGDDTNIVLPKDYNGENYEIYDYAFFRCSDITSVSIPSGVTAIGARAFMYCTKLTNVTFGSGVTVIGGWAFANCEALTSIALGANVTTILSGAFLDCKNLASITLGDRVTTIKSDAFENCKSLTDITIPSSVTEIDGNVFVGCSALTNIYVYPDNEYYKSLYGNLYNKSGNVIISYAAGKTETSFTIPSGVVYIGDGAFEQCGNLETVVIPYSVTTIGTEAFLKCDKLSSVTMGSGITEIGALAFGGCSSLTKITIPGSVKRIGENAFSGCSSLTSVTFENPNGWRFADNDLSLFSPSDLANKSTAAEYLTSLYVKYLWQRKAN